MFRRLSQWWNEAPPEKASQEHLCDAPNCTEPGTYRAPKSRDNVGSSHVADWHWFCLTHVRQYNAAWNYYANMSQPEVEADIRATVTWDRPSWPMGYWTKNYSKSWMGNKTTDPFDLLSESHSSIQTLSLTPQETTALHLFGLSFPFSHQELRIAYRQLVKEHHPDRHQGAAHAEETLKQINEAYGLLKKWVNGGIETSTPL